MRRGFTLVELLVVIGIIAVLAAILFPVVGAATRSARKAKCISNLRQLAQAQRIYSDDYDRTLVPARAGTVTWCELLQPQMKNDKIILCPEETDGQKVTGLTDLKHSYGINYNLTFNSSWSAPYTYKMSALNDTSSLIMFFDLKSGQNAMGSSYTTNRLTRVDPRHAGRCGVAFLDGHVKMVLPKETEKPVNMWMAK